MPPASRVARQACRLAALLMAVLVVGVACGSENASGPTQIETTTTSPAPALALAALMTDTVPDGFVLQPDDVGDTGPSDLAKAVRDNPTPGTKDALVSEGFVGGYQRLWVKRTTDDHDELILFLYRFNSADGATAEWTRLSDRSNASAAEPMMPFTPAGLPDGSSVGFEASKGAKHAVSIGVHDGVHLVLVISNGTASAEETRVRATDLAAAELTRI